MIRKFSITTCLVTNLQLVIVSLTHDLKKLPKVRKLWLSACSDATRARPSVSSKSLLSRVVFVYCGQSLRLPGAHPLFL